MKIYITHPIPKTAIEMLKAKNFQIYLGKDARPISQKKILSVLREAKKRNKPFDIILTQLTDKIDKNIFIEFPEIKMISNFAIGFDNIDLNHAKEYNVTITNTPGNYCDSIAEHVLAMTLALTRRIAEADRFVKKSRFKGFNPMLLIGDDIKGKTIGLIGTGRIGMAVAEKFYKGFDSRILYFDIEQNYKIENDYKAIKKEINDILKEADIISLHVPLNDKTYHLIDKNRLKMIKKEAYIINTSRGAVIDEKALFDSLKREYIKGAALDVFEFEPKIIKGLLKLENTILTPHIASASICAREEMARVSAQNIIDFVEKRKPFGFVV